MNILTQAPFTFAACIILFVSSGCNSNNRAPVDLHDFDVPKFVNTWLEESCELPCWHGIVPGQTHLGEAINTLNSIPEVSYIETFAEIEDAGGNVRFDVTGGGYRIIGGLLAYDSSDKIIDKIQYFAGDSIALQDMVEVLGEPSHFIASATNYDSDEYVYEIEMLFSEKGVLISWGGFLDQNRQLLLDPDQNNLIVTFISPDLIRDYSLDSNEIPQEWPGFILLESTCGNRTCQLTPAG